jgi:hypothetical protein
MHTLCDRGREVLVLSISSQKSRDPFFGFPLDTLPFFGDPLEYFGVGKKFLRSPFRTIPREIRKKAACLGEIRKKGLSLLEVTYEGGYSANDAGFLEFCWKILLLMRIPISWFSWNELPFRSSAGKLNIVKRVLLWVLCHFYPPFHKNVYVMLSCCLSGRKWRFLNQCFDLWNCIFQQN